jgi:hypothetical protein
MLGREVRVWTRDYLEHVHDNDTFEETSERVSKIS